MKDPDVKAECLLYNIGFKCIDRFIVLVSGLELGGQDERLFSLQLLVDLLVGYLGDGEQQQATSQIAFVVVAGNSLSSSTQDRDSFNKVNIF